MVASEPASPTRPRNSIVASQSCRSAGAQVWLRKISRSSRPGSRWRPGGSPRSTLSVVTPCHSPSGAAVFQFALSVQPAPPVASQSASSTARSPCSPSAPAVVTTTVWVALRPSGSCAVTVTVAIAVPAVPGASQTTSPDTRTVTVAARLDVAA